MAKKGQIFQTYTEEFKVAAVKAYLEGSSSYKIIAEQMKIRNCSQLKVWVKKWKNGVKFDERKGVANPLKCRPRTSFASIEQERDYLKAQVDYLKKRYPNLVDREVDKKKRRWRGCAPFGPGLPVHVSSVQETIRSTQRQRQPLSQSNLPG
ncbi:transposase [Paenibacillus sp. PvR052]|nr:transposase-like protein [Paenibacillus sp. PvP091]MBP1169996.1 transposase-like protein [Paenibacillus sp. PvR098]MBP2441024.1 transposase-like protein [Paenibacillus sp. PvP052]